RATGGAAGPDAGGAARLGQRAASPVVGAPPARGGRGVAVARQRQGGPAAAAPPCRGRECPVRLHVFAVPMRTRFRGITVREGALVEGEHGWGEWSPFLEYGAAVAE